MESHDDHHGTHDHHADDHRAPDQPQAHEIGRRVYLIADVEPLDVNGVRTVAVGAALWIVAFVALLPFYGQLRDAGRGWWLWTCMAGFSLGLFGYEYCRRRRARDEQAREPSA